jgi:YD repeat-containing protein
MRMPTLPEILLGKPKPRDGTLNDPSVRRNQNRIPIPCPTTTNFVTDARGAKTIFGYNPRHLVSSISYDLSNVIPDQNVAATPNVLLTYDAAGNRKTMSDGLGGVTYAYDNLSQLTSETRSFTGLSSYTLSYSYNLVGELSSITNPLGTLVNYGYDKIGRLTGATGAAGANPSTYASALTYRAFGAIKGMNYGDGRGLSTTYDSRMRTTKWDVSNVLGYNYNYDYLNEHTGRVTYAASITDATLDRSYEYDSLGRLVVSHSGAEARAHVGTGQWGTMDGPYSQGYDYDVWGNVTHKFGWGGEVQGRRRRAVERHLLHLYKQPAQWFQLRRRRESDQRSGSDVYLRCDGAADRRHLYQPAKLV